MIYRVYAEDFDENPTHYTDYYVGVQDVTTNIRFKVTINNQIDEILNDIYLIIVFVKVKHNAQV